EHHPLPAPRRHHRAKLGPADLAVNDGAADGGELAGEMADPAGGAVDQYPAAEQQPALAQRMQRRQPGDRQAPRHPLADPAGQRRGGASQSPATRTRWAEAPDGNKPTTRVPAGGPLPSAAGASTMPAKSQPGRAPAGSAPTRA